MKNKIRTFATLALVVALVASAAGPATAALTYDSESTDSTSTSDLVGGETVTSLDNETTYKTIQVIAGNSTSSSLTAPEEAFKLEMSINDPDNDDDGRTFYTNTSTAQVVNASAGHYAFNVSHAEMFDEMTRDADENVTVDVTVTFNESETDEESATITVYAQNADTRVVDVVTDAEYDDEDDVEVVNQTRTLRDDLEYASYESEHDITENTSRVSIVFANDTVADRYSSAYDVESFDSEDYIWTMTAMSEGTPIMVFDSEAGEERDAGIFSGGFDPDEDTHAVYMHNGGDYGSNAQLDIIPAGDDAEESSLEIDSSGNKALGFWSNYKNFGRQAAQANGLDGIAPAA